MVQALLAFGLAFSLGLVLVPLARRASFYLGVLAGPRPDRWHKQATPVLGGVGIFTAFLASWLAVSFLSRERFTAHWGLLAGSSVVFLLGLYDDFRPVKPPAKIVGQILAATVVISLGYTTRFFSPRIPDDTIAQVLNILLTFAWLVGITNAINLLDNMDGLAAGLAVIAAAILSFFFWKSGDDGLLLVSLCLAGSALAFLVFNFPPASIFMGDSGSLFLGFTLATLAIARQPQASNVLAVMGVPTLLFLLPILDMAMVTFTRLLRGQSPAQGGRDHTSHRLIALGLTERQALIVFFLAALVSGILAAALESLAYWLSLAIVPLLVLSLALVTAYLGRLRVLPGPGGPERGQTLTRIVLELTYRRRVLDVSLDFFVICLAYYLAFLVQAGMALDSASLDLFLKTLPLALGGAYLSFYAFGIYRGVWRYMGLDDLLRYIPAVLGSTLLASAAAWAFYGWQAVPLVVFLLFAAFLFLGLASTRLSFKLFDRLTGRQVRAAEQRVLVCGASDLGEVALRWILTNSDLGYRPVGILDDNRFMTGRRIHGVEVLGGLEDLEAILERKLVDGVILADGGSTDGSSVEKVMAACRLHHCWVRSLRLEFELLEDR